MKIRILFYKSKWGDKKWIDNLISLWTWSKYSHVEIWTPDSLGQFTCTESRWVPAIDVNGNECTDGTCQQQNVSLVVFGTCWTSTMRGKDNGTVKRPASGTLKNPKRWRYIEAEMETANYESMIRFLENEVRLNIGYSKRDLAKFLSPIHFPDNKRNICSEIVNNALCVGLLLRGFGIIDPGEVGDKLLAEGLEIKELA